MKTVNLSAFSLTLHYKGDIFVKDSGTGCDLTCFCKSLLLCCDDLQKYVRFFYFSYTRIINGS